jgi:hypothetical protein
MSHSTPAGGWNAPTRFLPSAMFTAVLPPTAASTMPSSVVGTCTSRTPRSQVAATNPARSVTAPPPTPTTTSERVKPQLAEDRPAKDGDGDLLGLLGVGDLDRVCLETEAGEVGSHLLTGGAQRPRVDHGDLPRTGRRASRAAPRSLPITTSYGVAPVHRDAGYLAHRPASARAAEHPVGHLVDGGVDRVDDDGRHLVVERPALHQLLELASGGCPAAEVGRGPSPTRHASVSDTSRKTTRCARRALRVVSSVTAPPPSASTPSCSTSARATAARSARRRRRRSPGSTCPACGLDVVVGVAKPDAQPGERPPTGLAGPGRADEHQERSVRRYGAHPVRHRQRVR